MDMRHNRTQYYTLAIVYSNFVLHLHLGRDPLQFRIRKSYDDRSDLTHHVILWHIPRPGCNYGQRNKYGLAGQRGGEGLYYHYAVQ
jgi:hypothetical protein